MKQQEQQANMRACVLGLLLSASCSTVLAELPESRPAECLLQQQSKRTDVETLKPVGEKSESRWSHTSFTEHDAESECDGEVCYKDYGVGECRLSNRHAPNNEPQKLTTPQADCKQQCTDTDACLGYSPSPASCLLWVEGPLEAGVKESADTKTRCHVKARHLDSDSLTAESTEKSLVEGTRDSEILPDDDAKEAAAKAKGLTKSLEAAIQTETRLDANLDKMKAQLKAQQATHEAVANEVERIQKDLIIAGDSLSVCESDLSALSDELSSVKEDIAHYLAKSAQLAESIKSLKAALEEASRKKRELEAEKETTQKELSKVNSESANKLKSVAKLGELLHDAKDASGKAETDIRAKIDQARANAKAEQNRVSELRNNIQSTQEEVSRLTDEKEHLMKFLEDSKEAAGYLKPYNLLATSTIRQNASLSRAADHSHKL